LPLYLPLCSYSFQNVTHTHIHCRQGTDSSFPICSEKKNSNFNVDKIEIMSGIMYFRSLQRPVRPGRFRFNLSCMSWPEGNRFGLENLQDSGHCQVPQNNIILTKSSRPRVEKYVTFKIPNFITHVYKFHSLSKSGHKALTSNFFIPNNSPEIHIKLRNVPLYTLFLNKGYYRNVITS
jgi:hypothetical protein